jgi:hypothetical protein
MKKFYTIMLFLFMSVSVIAGNDDGKLFYLYPVPLKGNILSVKLNTASANITSIELRNLVGRKLNEKFFAKGSDELMFDDMDSYPNGVYVVIAKDSYGKIVEIAKFIINK